MNTYPYKCKECGIAWEFEYLSTYTAWLERGHGPCCGLKKLDEYAALKKEQREKEEDNEQLRPDVTAN